MEVDELTVSEEIHSGARGLHATLRRAASYLTAASSDRIKLNRLEK